MKTSLKCIPAVYSPGEHPSEYARSLNDEIRENNLFSSTRFIGARRRFSPINVRKSEKNKQN